MLELPAVLTAALRVYRTLFARTIVSTGLVGFVATALTWAQLRHVRGSGLLGVVNLGVLCAAVLVQGALIVLARDVLAGDEPRSFAAALSVARGRFWTMVLASLVYALATVGGLLLLVVPGLLVLARWSLMLPVALLEGCGVGAAQRRSRALVTPYTRPVLASVGLVTLVAIVPSLALRYALPHESQVLLASFVWSTLAQPLLIYVLVTLWARLVTAEHDAAAPAPVLSAA